MVNKARGAGKPGLLTGADGSSRDVVARRGAVHAFGCGGGVMVRLTSIASGAVRDARTVGPASDVIPWDATMNACRSCIVVVVHVSSPAEIIGTIASLEGARRKIGAER